MITIISDADKWDAAAVTSYYPFVSYKFGWLRSIGLCFAYLRPLPLARVGEEGSIEYICPCFLDENCKKIVSSAFLTPGFINKSTNPHEVVQKLIELAKKEKCRKICLQLPPNFDYAQNLLDKGFRLIKKICFFNLDVSGLESFDYYLNHCVSKGRKSDIKAAWQRGLEVEILIPAEEALNRFYHIYLEMCQRKSAEPFEKRFISTLAESLKEISRFWIAKTNDQDVGSALTFEFGNRLWIWFLQANRNFIHYKVDSFLYAEIIRYGFNKNIKIIDLGTSPLGDSLGDYKKRFGARPVFHELYELDISLLGIVKRSYVDLKRVIKYKWLTERPD